MMLEGYLDPLWLGTTKSLADHYIALVQARSFGPADWSALKKEAYSDYESREGPFGRHSDIIQQVGSTAVVSISGRLTNTESWINSYVGMLSYPKIRAAVSTAANAEGVSQILLNVGSPGGQVTGISETHDFLTSVGNSVPIYTYAGGDMASAAYWLGSVGRKIYTSDLANVGSIGVIAVHQEMTRMLDQEGVTATVLRQGKYKALGNPYEKLSEEAKDEIMESMGKVYDRFKGQISEARGLSLQSANKWAEGRVFFGYEAVANGLADAIMPLEKVLEVIERKDVSKVSRTPVARVSIKGGDLSMKDKITDQQRAALIEGASPEQVFDAEFLSNLSAEDKAFLESLAQTAEVKVEADAEAGKGQEKPAPTTEEASGSAWADRLLAKVEALQEANAELKAQVKAKDLEITSLNSVVGQFKGIVATSVNRMQVALGGAPNQVKAEDDATTLLGMHARAKELFESRFPVGGRAEVQTRDKENSEARKAAFQAPPLSAVRIKDSK